METSDFKSRTIIYVLATMAVLFMLSILCKCLGAEEFLSRFDDLGSFDILSAQIANTLIVLSLTSVLSENFGQAYWIDIKERKLIKPYWGCFIGITMYLLTGMVFSIAAYMLQFRIGLLLSSTCATMLLIILTYKMINIYFGKEELKRQLAMEYRYKMLSVKYSYVNDYLRKLEEFLAIAESENYAGKGKFVAGIKAEIASLKEELSSDNDAYIDKVHKNYIDKHIRTREEIAEINLQIAEYTKNAIIDNNAEIVRENVSMLIEAESYEGLLDLIEDLFAWDEKYTCRILRKLTENNIGWVMREYIDFFKSYALDKLLAEGGKLDALQDLLAIYDPSNKGLRDLEDRLPATEEDVKTMLKGADIKDLRGFYPPVKEIQNLYLEGKYAACNRALCALKRIAEQDKLFISYTLGVDPFAPGTEYGISYFSEDEQKMLDKVETGLEKLVL